VCSAVPSGPVAELAYREGVESAARLVAQYADLAPGLRIELAHVIRHLEAPKAFTRQGHPL
jgi:hypothetical protein